MADEYRDIRRALEERLATVQDSNGDPKIAYENVKFSPKGEDSWLRTRLNYTTSRPASVGADSQIRYDGIFFIDCFVKANKGTLAADNLAQQVLDLFPYSTLLTENSKEVRIRYSERSAGIQENDDPYYFVPVSVIFYSYI